MSAYTQKFVEMERAFLDENRGAKIAVLWVPGHMGIEGGDRADEFAKQPTELKLATETTTIAKLHWQMCNKPKTEWISKWAMRSMTGQYAISDRILHSLAGPHT
jgi:hypothetical protein